MEWPPHSGQVQEFPEIDRVEWFGSQEARRRLKPAQVPFIERLEASLGVSWSPGETSVAGRSSGGC